MAPSGFEAAIPSIGILVACEPFAQLRSRADSLPPTADQCFSTEVFGPEIFGPNSASGLVGAGLRCGPKCGWAPFGPASGLGPKFGPKYFAPKVGPKLRSEASARSRRACGAPLFLFTSVPNFGPTFGPNHLGAPNAVDRAVFVVTVGKGAIRPPGKTHWTAQRPFRKVMGGRLKTEELLRAEAASVRIGPKH